MRYVPYGAEVRAPDRFDSFGLHFDKLIEWEAKNDPKEKGAWLRQIAKAAPSEDAAARLNALVAANFSNLHRTNVFELVQPLAIGLGIDHPLDVGCLWHPTLGFPYIPGSGLKGLCLSFARDWLEIDDPSILGAAFGRDDPGAEDSTGNFIFFDAIPLATAKMRVEILTPHHQEATAAGAYKTDTELPIPIPYLAVAEKSCFRIAIARRPGAPQGDPALDEVWGWLEAALDLLGAGAKTSRAHGRMKPVAA